MGTFEHFPYTNFHERNLDEIAKTTGEAKEIAEEAKARVDLFDARITHVEFLEPIVIDNQARSQKNSDDISRINSTIDDLITEDEDLTTELNNQAVKNIEQDQRIAVLEGAAFEGITPPSKDEFDAATSAINEHINQLQEIVETGYNVEANVIPATPVLLKQRQGDHIETINSNIEVTGYYYKIGAIIKGEFWYRNTGHIPNWPLPNEYRLIHNNPADMPTPKNDITIPGSTITDIPVGSVVAPDLNTRGTVSYYYSSTEWANNDHYEFDSVYSKASLSAAMLIKVPFMFIAEHKPEQWDYEIYDHAITGKSTVINTNIYVQTAENRTKDYLISFKAHNIALATGRTNCVLGLPNIHDIDYFARGEAGIVRSTSRAGALMLQSYLTWWPLFDSFSATDTLECTISRTGDTITVTAKNSAGVTSSRTMDAQPATRDTPITIGAAYPTDYVCNMIVDHFKFKWL